MTPTKEDRRRAVWEWFYLSSAGPWKEYMEAEAVLRKRANRLHELYVEDRDRELRSIDAEPEEGK